MFNDDEIETIKAIIDDYGSDCPSTDWDKVLELKYKLGLEKRPTPEEIAEQERKRKEFAESPLGKIMAAAFKASNDAFLKNQEQWEKDFNFFCGGKIGSELKIRLPNDYIKKE